MASAAKGQHRGRTTKPESNAKCIQTASETGSSSTGKMSNPQQQGPSTEEGTNSTPGVHTPPAPAVGSYEWALEQKQQLVYKPPLLITKDALASYSQWLTALDWVIASLAPKSILPSSKMLAMRNQSAPYGYRGLDSAGQERPTYPQSYKSEAMCKRKGHGRGL
jgi:hypothetical protein